MTTQQNRLLPISNILSLRIAVAAALAIVHCTAAAAPSPEADYLREHYTKYEYNIPMRDGVHLFTAVDVTP